MEYIQNTISWTTFLWTCVITSLVYLISARTKIGVNFINTETKWTVRQWERVLLVVVMSMFILVNPVFHLLSVAIVGGLYYVLVHNKESNSNLFRLGETKHALSNSLSTSNKTQLFLECRAKDLKIVQSKEKLQRCLFSFPYIKDNPNPNIHLVDDKYEVYLELSNIEFTASLLEYLRHSGFEVEIKK